jgi:hypothetical protein
VQHQVADDDLVGGGAAQLACQAVVIEPHTRICLPRVLVDRRGLSEALRQACRADLPSEHTGSRGLRGRRAILATVVAPTPSRVAAYRRPCLRARSAGVDDVACVTVLGLSARIKDSLPDRRSTLVGWLSRRAACVNGRFRAFCATVIPRTALLVNARRRAFGLLHGRLLGEHLRLAVQLLCLRCRGSGHGP